MRSVECNRRKGSCETPHTWKGSVMRRVSLALLLFVVASAVGSLNAQSLMYRAPDLGGTWVSEAGVVQFNFVHRFHVFPGPANAVVNYPAFTLAAGVGHNLGFGLHFGTKSRIPSSGGSFNESEWFARWRVFGGPEGREGFAVAVTPAYNKLAKSVDGELGIDWTRRAKLVVPEGAAVVRIAQYKFATDTVRIAAGATVVWANDDVAEHTVTFEGTEPGSPTLAPGGTFSHRFDRPGTYLYHCTPHPFMKGVVIVR